MGAIRREGHGEHRNVLWIELTNFCNLQCEHCYNLSGPHESRTPRISVDCYQRILEQARAANFRLIQFIGGEPLFYPHIQQLVDYAVHLGVPAVEIFSNLTRVPNWLLQAPYKNLLIATSFYSDDEDVHDQICRTRGSFKRTLSSIKKVIAAGMKLRVGFIEVRENAGQFERVQDFLRNLGVKEIGYDAVRQFGRAKKDGPASMQELCGRCSDGNLCIDVEGNVSACIMSKPWAFSSIHNEKISDILSGLAFAETAKRIAEAVQLRFLSFDGRSQTDVQSSAATTVTPCTPQVCFPQTCQPQACGPVCYPRCGPT